MTVIPAEMETECLLQLHTVRVAESTRVETEQPPVQPNRAREVSRHARPFTSFFARAAATAFARRSASAITTERPSAVSR